MSILSWNNVIDQPSSSLSKKDIISLSIHTNIDRPFDYMTYMI